MFLQVDINHLIDNLFLPPTSKLAKFNIISFFSAFLDAMIQQRDWKTQLSQHWYKTPKACGNTEIAVNRKCRWDIWNLSERNQVTLSLLDLPKLLFVILLSNARHYKITFWKCELWLAKRCVSITVWKTWKGSCHCTPSWMVRRILRFDKECYFSFKGYFNSVFPYVIETLVNVWENSK